jgi:6-phosphogluconolactonase
MVTDVVVFPNGEQLGHAAARAIVQIANERIAKSGRFTLALSGGSTPKKLYGLLAGAPYRDKIDWSKTEIFWADERCVPPDDPESNYYLALEGLIKPLGIPESQVHRAPAEETDREAAAEKYEQELRRVFGTRGVPAFDLIQLGMGPEAHTASLFPHQDSLKEQTRLVIPVVVPKPPPPRLTLTPPVLNAAHNILFLVTGGEKAEAIQAVLEGPYQPEEYPAQIVRPVGDVTWMFDTAAASKLTHYRQGE